MDRREVRAHGLAIDRAGDADDRGVGAGADAPDMEGGDACVACGFDVFAHLGFEMVVGRVQQDGCGIAQQGPGPERDDDRADEAHHWIEPYPAEIGPGEQRDDREHRGQGVGKDVDEGRPQIVARDRRGYVRDDGHRRAGPR